MSLKKKAPAKRKPAPAKAASAAPAKREEVDYEAMGNEYRKQKGGAWWKIPEGKTKVRFIPWMSKQDGRMKLFTVQRRHFNLGGHKVLPCTGQGCPVCALRDLTDDKKMLEDLKSSSKWLCLVVLREDGEERIQCFRASYTIWNDVMEVVADTENYPNALSLEDGIDFILTKTGSGFSTKYSAKPLPKRTPVDPAGLPSDLDTMTEMNFDEDLSVIADKIATEYGLV